MINAVTDWVEDAEGDEQRDVPLDSDQLATMGQRLVLTLHLLELLSRSQSNARAVQPETIPEAVPVRMDLTGDGVRTVELSDIWRLRLTGNAEEQRSADERLSDFYTEERQFFGAWDEQRRRAARHDNRELVRACGLASRTFDILLHADEKDVSHPVLQGLHQALERDVARMRRELDDALWVAEQELAAIEDESHESESSA
jgi:hypothetical protein